MLKGSMIFLILAIIAGLFSLGIIAEAAIGIARVLFVVFLVLFIVSLIRHKRRGF